MDTSLSSSLSYEELQLALQDVGPAELQSRQIQKTREGGFVRHSKQPPVETLTSSYSQHHTVISVDDLPESMRLNSSKQISLEAAKRTRQ